MGTETKYTAAVSVDDGLYEVVVASEGVKPCIGNRWLWGIDPKPQDDGYYSYRLAIPEGTPEGSVILIKGRPGGGEKEIYRLFRFIDNQLTEITPGERVGGWSFDAEYGQLTECASGCRVNPGTWGYCLIIEQEWDTHQHFAVTMIKAGFVYDVDSLPPILSRGCYLVGFSKAIKDRRRADQAEAALRQIACKLLIHDLLDAEVGSKHRQKGHLRALANAPEPTKHCAAGVIRDLRETYEFCREPLPELPELPPNVLDG